MRGLKIAISGKGGVGKSTVAAVWSRLLAEQNLPVYAIDADPDANLAHALGMPKHIADTLKPLAADDELIEQRTGARRGRTGQIFSLTPDVADIAKKYAVQWKGVQVVVLGGIKKGGGGCACPESALLKSLVRYLILHENEIVILDMEAGIEHLGRATATGVDALVAVTEPGTRSLETALHIQQLAADIGLSGRFFMLHNKVRDAIKSAEAVKAIGPDVMSLGTIPYDERFITADEERKSIFDLADTSDTSDTKDLLIPFKRSLEKLTAAAAARPKATEGK
ncbi:MAG: AAA family ATPase [Chitinispirillaceae bacterium]|jgi:CO dehydrogenase maturation factor